MNANPTRSTGSREWQDVVDRNWQKLDAKTDADGMPALQARPLPGGYPGTLCALKRAQELREAQEQAARDEAEAWSGVAWEARQRHDAEEAEREPPV